MPGYDKTGPRGQGPMTGRGRGVFVKSKEFADPGFGGHGRRLRKRFFQQSTPGRFFGRGITRYDPELSPSEKVKMLKDKASSVEQELKSIKEEINRLKDRNDTTENTENHSVNS